MSLLHTLFQKKEEVNYKDLVKSGAIVLDVRSKEEFDSGHIQGAINIPLDILPTSLKKLGDKESQIIACCLSGGRSYQASRLLEVFGYIHVYDGGGWMSLQKKLL